MSKHGHQQYKILMSRDQQLHNQFLDLFTKHVVNSTQSVFFDHFSKEKQQIPYGEVYKFLKRHPEDERTKSTTRISPPYRLRNFNNFFAFESCNSSITLLLDLSPYMLNYDYQSKSTPLVNLQMVVKDLLIKIKQKKQALFQMYDKMQTEHSDYNWHVQFTLTVYVFSIYHQTSITVLYRQDVNYTSITLLQEFILTAVEKSQLPYEVHSSKTTKHSIANIIQKILDTEEPLMGIRSIIVVSSFNQKELNNKIFFTTNWYTFGFVLVGGHMGSCIVQERQILQRYGSSTFFQIKYVYTCKFLENWQKVDKIQKQKQHDFLTLKAQKHKTLIYSSDNKNLKNIFDELLQFKLQLKRKNSVNSIHEFVNTENPSMKGFELPKKAYKIPEWNFNFILRTRYQQGWQPIVHDKKGVKVLKCVFKLDFNPQIFLIYKAELVTSNEGHCYMIQILGKLSTQTNLKKYKQSKEFKLSIEGEDTQLLKNLLTLIKDIDMICTSQYKSMHTKFAQEKQFKRKQYLSPLSLRQESEIMSLRYVLKSTGSWGKFSKLKYIYFIFYPGLYRSLYEEFLNEISSFIGEKPFDSSRVFMKKSWGQNQKTNTKEHKIQFSELITNKNMMKIKLGYVNYSFKEIKQILEPFIYKFENKKFKSGDVMVVYDEMFKFNLSNELPYQKMFENQWKIRIQNSLVFKAFNYYFKAILKEQAFEEIGDKRPASVVKSYAKRILVNQIKEDFEGTKLTPSFKQSIKHSKPAQKTIFCNIQQQENEITFVFMMFPLIGKLVPFDNEYGVESNRSLANEAQFRETRPRLEISVYDFFCRFTQNLRHTQVHIMKLIHMYNLIHEALLLKTVQQKSSRKSGLGFSEELKELIQQMYPSEFRRVNFESEYDALCHSILAKYCPKESDRKKKQIKEELIDIDFIPHPATFFIEAEVEEIKGDLVVKKNGKECIFFLFSPFNPIYIFRNENKFYYKSINLSLMLQKISSLEGDPKTIQIMKSQIKLVIQKQEYRKLYSQFFNSANSAPNSPTLPQILKKTSKSFAELQTYITKTQKFNPPIKSELSIQNAIQLLKHQDKPIQSGNEFLSQQIDKKVNPIVKELIGIYFELVRNFFDRKVSSYYFQKDNTIKDEKNLKFSLKSQKMEHFEQLITKNYLKISTNEEIIITEQNLSTLLNQYQAQLISSKAQIVFECLSQLSEEISKPRQTFTYFMETMNGFCQQFAKQIQRVIIMKSKDLQKLKKYQNSTFFNRQASIPFSKFYDKLAMEKVSRYIQASTMQKLIPLKKIPNNFYHYICAKESKNNKDQFIFEGIPFWLYLQITDSQILISYYEYQFFSREQIMAAKVQNYIKELINYVNCDILIWEMSNTMELPLQPHELFVSPLVNNPNNKLVEIKKKNTQKKAPKRIRAKIESQKRQNLKEKIGDNVILNQTQPVPQIAKNFIMLNQRFKPGEGLEALQKYQNFQFFQIINLKQTYLFPTSFDNNKEKQNLIFHFEEEDFDKVSKQISPKEVIEFNGKPKRVLVCFVHGLNPSVIKTQNYNFICNSIKDAISQKIFEIVSHELFISPEIVQPFEERQLKRGMSLNFSFEIPFIPYIDDFRGYLKQHISMYHTKTELKSEKNKTLAKMSNEEDVKIQRSQSILSRKSYTRNQDGQSKQKISNIQSFSQQIQVQNISQNYSESFRQNYKNNSTTSFSAIEDARRGIIFSKTECTLNENECEKCIPTTWLFNYKKNIKLQSKFGKCIYLLKIETQHNCAIAQNVKIWERQMGQKDQITPKDQANQKQQAGQKDKTAQKEQTLSRKPKSYISGNLTDTQKRQIKEYLYGSKTKNSKTDLDQAIYKTTITFNIFHILGNPIKHAIQEVFSSIIKTAVSDYYIQNLLNHHKVKQSPLDLEISSSKRIDERLLFSKQSSTHTELMVEEISLSKVRSEVTQSMSNSAMVVEPIDLTSSFTFQIKDADHIEELRKKQSSQTLFKEILHFSESVDKIIDLSTNESLFKVTSNETVLMKSPKTYFIDFYQYLLQTFEEQAVKNLLFVYYVEWIDSFKPISFFIDEIEDYWKLIFAKENAAKEKEAKENLGKENGGKDINLKDFIVEEKVKKLTEKLNMLIPVNSQQTVKRIGLICNDQFFEQMYINQFMKRQAKKDQAKEIPSLSKRDLINSQTKIANYTPIPYSEIIISKLKSVNLQTIDRSKIFIQDRAYCLQEYIFTRSLYIHYEISVEGFKYYSYNMSIFLNSRLKEFLAALQIWLEEKYRLYKFILGKNVCIQGVKREGSYDRLPQYKGEKNANKFGFIFELYLETLKSAKQQEDQKRVRAEQMNSLSLSKILLNLAFSDYPPKYQDGTLINLSKQIEEIYEILKVTAVDYSEYPEYKGKEKFILEKLGKVMFNSGKQYISLLRVKHGFRINGESVKASSEKVRSVTQA